MSSDDATLSVLRRFGSRLHHATPRWVQPGSFFHIRIRVAEGQPTPLTHSELADALLASARFYHDKGHWWLGVFLLMPDHLHALIAFQQPETMRKVIGSWKRWHARRDRVSWQDGYFDHRVRDEGDGFVFRTKFEYILNNPVRAGVCATPEEWTWKI